MFSYAYLGIFLPKKCSSSMKKMKIVLSRVYLKLRRENVTRLNLFFCAKLKLRKIEKILSFFSLPITIKQMGRQ